MDVHFSFVTPAGVRIIVPGTGAVILGKTEKTNKFFCYLRCSTMIRKKQHLLQHNGLEYSRSRKFLEKRNLKRHASGSNNVASACRGPTRFLTSSLPLPLRGIMKFPIY